MEKISSFFFHWLFYKIVYSRGVFEIPIQLYYYAWNYHSPCWCVFIHAHISVCVYIRVHVHTRLYIPFIPFICHYLNLVWATALASHSTIWETSVWILLLDFSFAGSVICVSESRWEGRRRSLNMLCENPPVNMSIIHEKGLQPLECASCFILAFPTNGLELHCIIKSIYTLWLIASLNSKLNSYFNNSPFPISFIFTCIV